MKEKFSFKTAIAGKYSTESITLTRLDGRSKELTVELSSGEYVGAITLDEFHTKHLSVMLLESLNNVKPKNNIKLNIAEEAINIVHGDREQTYGSPTKNLDTIAQFWNGYINSKNKSDTSNLTGQDVSHLMMLLKIARLANSPDHRDSLVDTVGYALLSEICNGDKK